MCVYVYVYVCTFPQNDGGYFGEQLEGGEVGGEVDEDTPVGEHRHCEHAVPTTGVKGGKVGLIGSCSIDGVGLIQNCMVFYLVSV
jgi:hypothetical protein